MAIESSNLPSEVNHPAHRHAGPLALTPNYPGGIALVLGLDGSGSCSICGSRFREQEFIYSCPQPDCPFVIHVSCSSIKSIIAFNGHRHHPLCFVERPALGIINCRLCQDGPSDPELPIFRCGECCFSLHLLCGPFPRAVIYNTWFELTLTDSLLCGVDANDCWCDICEEQRDPNQCVYHSPDIWFTASTDYLMPQISAALRGDLGEVELRTVGGYIPGKVIVKHQPGEDVLAAKTESKLNGVVAVEEESTSAMAEAASRNPSLDLLDSIKLVLASLLVHEANEQSKEETTDPEIAMINMCEAVLTSQLEKVHGTSPCQ